MHRNCRSSTTETRSLVSLTAPGAQPGYAILGKDAKSGCRTAPTCDHIHLLFRAPAHFRPARPKRTRYVVARPLGPRHVRFASGMGIYAFLPPAQAISPERLNIHSSLRRGSGRASGRCWRRRFGLAGRRRFCRRKRFAATPAPIPPGAALMPQRCRKDAGFIANY